MVCDHDSVVLARRMLRGSAWCVSEILAWAGPVAAKAGFAGLVADACRVIAPHAPRRPGREADTRAQAEASAFRPVDTYQAFSVVRIGP